MLFIHNNKVYIEMSLFDPAMLLQDWSNTQEALITAIRTMSEHGGPGEFKREIAYLTYLLDDLRIATKQGKIIEQGTDNILPVLFSHPDPKTLFPNPTTLQNGTH